MTARLVSGSGSAELRRRLGPSAWCALECLVERSADGRTVEASVRAIAADLGVARNTAHRAIAALMRAQLVQVEQHRDVDGRFQPGRYRLHVDELIEHSLSTRSRRHLAQPTLPTAALHPSSQLSLLDPA